ncbi:SAM-dependent methyltransferase [Hahella chejuensis KCTC 2396]|uniref:SAM-dependent methyltransferase n=1 Tax=Hahella chejuensis (strain KCTC 2396) TaxID=349521 RepID=Q2SQG1_HAHCH|nr:methyltransferase domain-containing protein [Hahella chejuensis]ABC27113.1 SAM-dependent methyltransferase [Hahella chejuensis KCTC 2396]
MYCHDEEPSPLLINWQDAFRDAPVAPVLDLACGHGRNGLWLARRGRDVVFADRDAEALDGIAEVLSQEGLPGRIWCIDLETRLPDLDDDSFSAILVFRYLHRPLFPLLRRALAPGGYLFYETFTWEQPQYGRPSNPDFLLQPGELRREFGAWDEVHYFEGVDPEKPLAISQWVGQKPRLAIAELPPLPA